MISPRSSMRTLWHRQVNKHSLKATQLVSGEAGIQLQGAGNSCHPPHLQSLFPIIQAPNQFLTLPFPSQPAPHLPWVLKASAISARVHLLGQARTLLWAP